MDRVRTTAMLAGLLAHHDLDCRPDGELLARFARYGDGPAFEALVRRHGGLVLGVCRRLLPNPADAEDAFQATFLVLVRKSGSVRDPGRLGPWLYGVAVRVARKARSRQQLRPLPDDVAAAESSAELAGWVEVLDRELAGLPARYRDALVLCELQGVSRRAAADRLGIREGTLSRRLARGRVLLRRRLLKHGTLLPAAGLAGLLGSGPVASAGLVARAAGLTHNAGAVPAGVLLLTDEVLRVMLIGKLTGYAAAAGSAVVVAGLLLAGGPAGPGKPGEPAPVAAAKPPVAGGTEIKQGKLSGPDREVLQGVWRLEDLPLSEAALKKLKADLNTKDPDTELRQEFEVLRQRHKLVVHGDDWWSIDLTYATGESAKLTTNREPKWVDLKVLTQGSGFNSGTPQGELTKGIYRLTDDTLTVAQSHIARPAELGPVDDVDSVGVKIYRKEPIARYSSDHARERARFLGRWELIRHVSNFEQVGVVKESAGGWLYVTPYYLFLHPPDIGREATTMAITHAATFALDPSKNPAWIDTRFVNAGEEQPERFGTYQFDGDILRLVLGENNDRLFRPLEFAVEPRKKPRESDSNPKPDRERWVEVFEFKRAKAPDEPKK